MKFFVGQTFYNKEGSRLTIDYVGPRACNFSFDNEPAQCHQATFSQLKAIIESGGYKQI